MKEALERLHIILTVGMLVMTGVSLIIAENMARFASDEGDKALRAAVVVKLNSEINVLEKKSSYLKGYGDCRAFFIDEIGRIAGYIVPGKK